MERTHTQWFLPAGRNCHTVPGGADMNIQQPTSIGTSAFLPMTVIAHSPTHGGKPDCPIVYVRTIHKADCSTWSRPTLGDQVSVKCCPASMRSCKMRRTDIWLSSTR